jgi:colanic acid/amylovoran biosynthesis glycosyltransferase
MRIGIITEYYPAAYKPYFDSQFAQFIRDGHEIAIYAQRALGSALSESVARRRLPERTTYYPASLRDVPRHAARAITALAAHPAFGVRTALVARTCYGSARRRLVEWVRMLSLPPRPPDVWLIHNLSAATQFTWLGKVYPKVPIMLYYHGGEVPRYSRELPPPLVKAAFDTSAVVFTNTQFSKCLVTDRGCDPRKVVVIPVGYDLADFRPDPEREYRSGGMLRLVSAGRLSEEKGQIFALEAVKMLVRSGMTNLLYTVVGDGYLRPDLERFVRDNGLEQYVKFLGTLSPDATVREFSKADALLLPSVPVGNCIETQGCVLQEALLTETAVITSALGGVLESTPDLMHPYSVPGGDAVALAESITRMSALPPDNLRALGRAGRAWVLERYDIRLLNARMVRIAQSLSAQSGES